MDIGRNVRSNYDARKIFYRNNRLRLVIIFKHALWLV